MSVIPLSLALSFVRQDEGVEDDVCAVLLDGAEAAAFAYLNRDVYPDQETLDAANAAGMAGPFALVINGAIKAAILKTFAELYTNREDSAGTQKVAEMPFNSRTLLRPWRVIPGV
ncbi:head-tail connector protein [Burkholderia sp. JSH-S8]|nr:head-tail connector protein [Burkholderia sp. JSH-S8]